MKKLCFVTTVSLTIKAFLIPVLNRFRDNTSWELTVICDEDDSLQEALPAGVRYIPVPMKRGISLGGIGACWKMYQIFRKEKFDLVQYSTPNASVYASIAAWAAGVKHRIYHLMGYRFLGFSGIKAEIFKLLEKLACSLATKVECVSKSNLRIGVEMGLFPDKKVSVLYHGSSAGVDLGRFDISKKEIWRKELRQEFGYSNADCVFGFAGRITGDKGINELLRAFEKMSRADTRLFLVGRQEEQHTLDQRLWNQAINSDRVTVHPEVKDIERYFSMMDVLILPSYREGFGNIVIEAEAMGVPVIVTDIPGPTDAMLPEETGLVVKVRDVDSLYAAMERLAGDPELRKRLGKAGAEFAARNFDQKILTEKILADRKRLLGICEE
ncbi:MAG: glycosyltransferase family 4 protein [Oscillospiraceae bacterium]|nr:glycosyltransferase family 4 protein [Oscillospiraceae bacterium]